MKTCVLSHFGTGSALFTWIVKVYNYFRKVKRQEGLYGAVAGMDIKYRVSNVAR